METMTLNWLAVLLAALSSFLVGGIWYGPLFGEAWMREHGLTEDELNKRNMPMVFGLSFVLALVASSNLSFFIGPEASVGFATFAGFAAGLGWVATFLAILYLFEHRSLKAYLINAGYCVTSLTLMGLILGVL